MAGCWTRANVAHSAEKALKTRCTLVLCILYGAAFPAWRRGKEEDGAVPGALHPSGLTPARYGARDFILADSIIMLLPRRPSLRNSAHPPPARLLALAVSQTAHHRVSPRCIWHSKTYRGRGWADELKREELVGDAVGHFNGMRRGGSLDNVAGVILFCGTSTAGGLTLQQPATAFSQKLLFFLLILACW